MKALKLIFLMMGLALAASSCCRRTVSEVSNKATEISASSSVAVVSTDKGKVAGYVENGIYIFKGIPYARADRFQQPHPVEKW